MTQAARVLRRINELIRILDVRLYGYTVNGPLEPFEEAKVRLNLRLTWIFVFAGIVYASTFIYRQQYFVVLFSLGVSLSFLLLPVTIKFGYIRLKKIVYYSIVSVFIFVNIFGTGNQMSIPVVLWLVLALQVTSVILTHAESLIVACLLAVVFTIKWHTVSRGVNYPFWIPSDVILHPRFIDYATPLFFNLTLNYNSLRLYRWAQDQLISANEEVRSLNKAVADTEWRNNLIVEQSLGYISIHNDKGILTFINSAASRALGYSPAELTGMPVSAVLHPDVRENFGKYLQVISTTGSAEGIMRVRSRDGSKLFWYYRNVAIRDEVGNMSVLGFAHDITELEVTRQQLQKARAEAEESDRLKSLFLANISHEFRTPMNAIIGFSELLENPNLTSTRRVLFTRHIRERSLNLLGMLNNLLDFSRIEAGHLVLQPLDGNIDEHMDKVIVSIGAEATYIKQKEVEIRKINHLPQHLHKASLDFFKLSQVLVNLMSNAMKFTQEGYILLECRESSSGELLFSISDTGEGIPADKLEAIFKPFRQADNSIQRKFGGSGLGLAICKSLVESWKGKIWAESEPGKGSTFYFTIGWNPPNTI